jgi:transposase-like protein
MFTVSSSEDDPIEALVRRGAKVMLQAALEQEVSQYLERARHQRSENESEFRGYRNGHSQERKISIGSGTIKIKTPRVSDVPAGQAEFESKIARAVSAALAVIAAGVSQVVYRRFGDQRL